MSAVIESSYQHIPIVGGKGSARSPDCHVERVIPGWKDIVQPYRDDAKFWSSVWQSAGRPSHGVLKDLMSRTRNQFQYAIRRVKKMSNSDYLKQVKLILLSC